MSPPRVVAAAPEHADALARLFATSATPCHCRYWHFEGDKNAWLERCAFSPEASEREMREALAAGRDDARGVVALDDAGRALGWLKLAPARSLAKLYDQKPWRGLPIFSGARERVLTVGCLLVEPTSRRRGVARALVAGALELARALGASAVEAFPRRVPEGAHDEDLWLGPESPFVEQGFEVVHELGAYPVMRWTP